MQNLPKHVLRSASVPQEPFGSPFLQERQKMLATLAYSDPPHLPVGVPSSLRISAWLRS